MSAADPRPVAPVAARSRSRRRLGPALFVLCYAVPLTVAVVLLYVIGDGLIATALLVVELMTTGGIQLVLHTGPQNVEGSANPQRPVDRPVLGLPGEKPMRGSNAPLLRIVLGMVGVVVAVGVVIVVALAIS